MTIIDKQNYLMENLLIVLFSFKENSVVDRDVPS